MQVRLVLAQKLLKNLKMGVRARRAPAMHLPWTRSSCVPVHPPLHTAHLAQRSSPPHAPPSLHLACTRLPHHRAVCQPDPAGATKAAHARASSGGGVSRGVTAQSCYYGNGL